MGSCQLVRAFLASHGFDFYYVMEHDFRYLQPGSESVQKVTHRSGTDATWILCRRSNDLIARKTKHCLRFTEGLALEREADDFIGDRVSALDGDDRH